MDARQDLYEDLIVCLIAEGIPVNEIKESIYTALAKYEVQERCTEVALLQTDRNEYLLKKFIVAKMVKGCTKRTIEYYTKTLKTIIGKIGKTVDDIEADDIRLYIAKRIKVDKISKVTADNELRALRTFYSYMTNDGLIKNNPMIKVERIKVQRMKKEALTDEEIEKIRYEASKDERATALVEIMLCTGARVSEITGIKLDEIEEDRILVHGKGEKDRYVYLNAKAKLAIERYIKERNDNSAYLFPGRKQEEKGKGWSTKAWWKQNEHVAEERPIDKGAIEQRMRKIAKKAGVEKANPHKFRRTCATMALRRGMPIEQVSKMLGHESIETTQIYLDLNEDELKQVHKKLMV